MAEQHQALDARVRAKQPQVEAASLAPTEVMVGAEWPCGPQAAMAAASPPDQASALGNSQIQQAQRIQLAGRIGRTQGNQHLQGLLASRGRSQARAGRGGPSARQGAEVQLAEAGEALEATWLAGAPVLAAAPPPHGGNGHGRIGLAQSILRQTRASAIPSLAASGTLGWSAGQAPVQREDGAPSAPGDPAARAAQEVYDALDGWNDEARAARALQGHDAGMRQQIQSRFVARYHQNLRDYLKGQLSGDWLVKISALLTSTNYHEHHTAMALALIPTGTRDAEVWRVLNSLPLAGRQAMERKYDEAFAYIGKGSLKADLKDDLSGWALEKSLAMLHHDLKSAEHLYFDSVAITGTHTEAVISRIQSEWGRGPQSFVQFERDWDQYVRNQASWSTEPAWTDMTLRAAMDSELSGESWELVRAVLGGYQRFQQGINVEVGPLSEDQIFQQEEIQLGVAEGTLTAATTGGFTGLGTNNEQVFQAVSTIRQIWQQRIERADRAGDAQLKSNYERSWNTRRQLLMDAIPSEMDEDTAEFRRVRLLTLGDLTPADEVYLAGEGLDMDRVVSLVTRFWAQGKMGDLLSRADTERTASFGGTQTVVRPRFDVNRTVPVTSGITAARVYALTRTDDNDAGRGARRLKVELDEGDSDSDLRKGYELLTSEGISAGLRSSAIETFASRNLAGIQGDTAARKFLTYIDQRYERSNTCWEFRDLIAPTTEPSEMVRRAGGRLAASRTGALDVVLGGLADAYGAVTGEDTQAVAVESLERLQFIASRAGARPDELAAMMAMTGATGPAQLAGMEYEQFRARLEELRALKRSIAEALATAIELAVEAAITVATAGTAAPALLATLSAAVAGMVVREGLLGQDYNLVSRENAQRLALVVASAGFGAIGSQVGEGVIDAERLQRMGRVGAFAREAISEGVKQAGVQTMTAGFEGRLPTTENIVAGVLSVVGSAAGEGTRAAIRHDLAANLPIIERLRVEAAARVSQDIIGAVTDQASSLAREGLGNRTWADVAAVMGRSTGTAIASGLSRAAGDVEASRVERRREQAAEGPARVEAETRVGPAANIPEDPGAFAERGVFNVTTAETYLVRAGPPGRYGDHLFGSLAEARAYAQQLAHTGEASIRETSALPRVWEGGAEGNPVDVVRVYAVPPRTAYIQGVVGEQTEAGTVYGAPVRYRGGGPQVAMERTVRLGEPLGEFPVAGP